MARVTGPSDSGPPSARFGWEKALRHRNSRLPPTAILVALMVGTFMDSDGRAWPSLDTLAEEIGLDRSTVVRAMKQLVEAGWLARVGRTGFGGSTVYVAQIPEANRCTSAPDEEDANRRTHAPDDDRQPVHPCAVNRCTHAPGTDHEQTKEQNPLTNRRTHAPDDERPSPGGLTGHDPLFEAVVSACGFIATG